MGKGVATQAYITSVPAEANIPHGGALTAKRIIRATAATMQEHAVTTLVATGILMALMVAGKTTAGTIGS